MKKFQGNKEEILELHNKNKTHKMVLNEQAGDIRSKLQSMIDKGQVTNVVGIAELETSNPDRRFAIKKKSTKNPGTFVYLFHDFKYGYFGPDGKFSYGNGVWTPSEPKPTPPSVDDRFKQAEIDAYKKKNNAKTKEEAISSGWDLTNLNKITLHGVDLYMQGSSSGVISGVSQDQKQALADYKLKLGAKEWDEMTGVEKANWEEYIVPNSKRLFGTEVRLYRPSTAIMSKDNEDIKTLRTDFNRTEDQCADDILAYFDDYRTGRPVPPKYWTDIKPVVQFCKNKFHNRWGLRPNARKLNKILDLMSRQIDEFQGVKLPPSFPIEGSDRHQFLLKNI